MPDANKVSLKVILVGEGGVGKTSLIKQYVHAHFDEKYIKTLGTNVYRKEVRVEKDGKNYNVHLQIWDILGQKVFQTIIKSAFKGTRGVMFVCDVTEKATLENLDIWIKYALDYGQSSAFTFIGNKSDLPNHRFSKADVEAYAKPYNGTSLVTSAKTGDQVEQAFKDLATSIINERYATIPDPPPATPVLEPVRETIKAEDQIITEFCNEAGGFQISMPIVRERFHKLGVDFENPSRNDLEKVIMSLVEYVMFIKGENEAHELEKRLYAILRKYGLE